MYQKNTISIWIIKLIGIYSIVFAIFTAWFSIVAITYEGVLSVESLIISLLFSVLFLTLYVFLGILLIRLSKISLYIIPIVALFLAQELPTRLFRMEGIEFTWFHLFYIGAPIVFIVGSILLVFWRKLLK